MVPKVGLEPTRYRYRWILSPVRLPVSPLGQRDNYIEFLIKMTILFYENYYLSPKMPFSICLTSSSPR